LDPELRRAREHLMGALGRQSGFWGVGKITGEIYAALYLSHEPLSLAQLAESLGVTKGNISVAIRTLEQLGMVKRSQRPGDRRVFFAAESDFWLIAHHVLERRQKPEFDESFRILDESIEQASGASSSEDQMFVLERLAALQDFYNELDEIVAAILALNPRRLSWLVRLAAKVNYRTTKKMQRRENKTKLATSKEE